MTATGPVPALTVERLRELADAGEVDTVLLAMADMQGRLQGKRCHARYFLDEVLPPRGRGLQLPARRRRRDEHRRRATRCRRGSRATATSCCGPTWPRCGSVPWHEGTALVHCDVEWGDGTPVAASPRQVLRRQLDRLAERGLVALVGTELELIVFRDTYEAAWDKGYRDLQPANQYNVDYSLAGTARIEHLLRRIRNGMAGAGMFVESAKGECNLGQHEIAFRYDEALATCDNHVALQDRRQGDRRAGGHEPHVHGQVRRARGQLLPHPPQPAHARRRAGDGRATATTGSRR